MEFKLSETVVKHEDGEITIIGGAPEILMAYGLITDAVNNFLRDHLKIESAKEREGVLQASTYLGQYLGRQNNVLNTASPISKEAGAAAVNIVTAVNGFMSYCERKGIIESEEEEK